jgi:hypothetical protein
MVPHVMQTAYLLLARLRHANRLRNCPLFGKTGSDRPTVKTTRLTRTGHRPVLKKSSGVTSHAPQLWRDCNVHREPSLGTDRENYEVKLRPHERGHVLG